MSIPSSILRAVAAAVAILVIGTGTLAACSGSDDSTASEDPTASASSLARTVDTVGAPGRALGLTRVVVPSGAKIPSHYHEGTQIARIESGTLTYSVETGSVEIMTGPGDDGQSVGEVSAGETGEIEAGQWIVEQPDEQHRAENRGDEDVVIYLANLIRENAEASTPVP